MGSGLFLIVIFTLLEPDISDPLQGGWLLLFWTIHVATALVLLQGMQMLLLRVPFMMRRPPWVQVALSGLIGALLFAPIAAVFDWMLGVDADAEDVSEGLFEALTGEFTGSVGIVLAVWIALNITRLLHIQSAGRVATPVADPAFWERVPKEIGRDLVALCAELHYMRVHTTKGEALILFPFGQAIDALEDTGKGVQVHRSHWVALAHVADVKRRGQGAVCVTSKGIELPVSRSRRKLLEAAITNEDDGVTSMA